MGLKIEVGDLFNETLDKNCIIVHGCNCAGQMGSGIAAIVRKLYPKAYTAYKQSQKSPRGLVLGDVGIVTNYDGGPTIANALTQESYGRDGKLYVSYDAVVDSMQRVAAYAKNTNLPVHLPLIGGGLGGGDHKRLIAIFQACFHDVDATLWLTE